MGVNDEEGRIAERWMGIAEKGFNILDKNIKLKCLNRH